MENVVGFCAYNDRGGLSNEALVFLLSLCLVLPCSLFSPVIPPSPASSHLLYLSPPDSSLPQYCFHLTNVLLFSIHPSLFSLLSPRLCCSAVVFSISLSWPGFPSITFNQSTLSPQKHSPSLGNQYSLMTSRPSTMSFMHPSIHPPVFHLHPLPP